MSETNGFYQVSTPPSSFMDTVNVNVPWERKTILECYTGPTREEAWNVKGPQNAANADKRRHSSKQKPGLHARIAHDRKTRSDAFRLRHLCYRSKGFIDARPNGKFSDEYDASADNTTIVLYDNGRAVGSVRICATPSPNASGKLGGLPVQQVFPAEMDDLLAGEKRGIEINRLVRHPDHAQDQGLIFTMFRMCAYLIGRRDPDYIISCVRPNHMSFYKRLRFEQVAGPLQYTGLKFMTNLMVLERDKWDMLNRLVPMLRLSQATLASYDKLWEGNSVPVFSRD